MKNPLALFGPQWIAKAATLVVVIAGAATIAISNAPQPADRAVTHLPAKDVATWTMPLDRYQLVNDDKENYATVLLVGACLTTEGFDWGVPWQNVNAFQDNPDTPVVAPLGASNAATRGYHGTPVDRQSSYLWAGFVAQPTLTTSVQREYDSCLSHIRKTTLRGAGTSGWNQTAGDRAAVLAHEAYVAAGREPAVVAAAARWRSCLAPVKVTGLVTAPDTAPSAVADLPSSPSGMPSKTVAQSFATSVTTGRITPSETTLAKADVACQTSSGYRKALYAAEYRLQTKVTADDAALLARATVDQRAYDRTLDRVIAANLPPRPAA